MRYTCGPIFQNNFLVPFFCVCCVSNPGTNPHDWNSVVLSEDEGANIFEKHGYTVGFSSRRSSAESRAMRLVNDGGMSCGIKKSQSSALLPAP